MILDQATAWETLAQSYWDREGAVIQSPDISLADDQLIFDILKNAASDYKERGEFGRLKFYIGESQVVQRVGDYLPQSSQPSLDSYLAFLDEKVNNADLMLYINNVQEYHPVVWVTLKKTLDRLYHHVDPLDGPVEVELFLGRYGSTPGGIHRDGCTNMHFVAKGVKQFYVWPEHLSYENNTAVTQAFSAEEAYLDDADLNWQLEQRRHLRAGEGSMIFCPHNWWHVAQADDLCICLNMAVYRSGRTKQQIMSSMSSVLDKVIKKENDFEYDSVVHQLSEYCLSNEFRHEFELERLNHRSSNGLGALRPSTIIEKIDIANFEVYSWSKLQYKVIDSKILISINGHGLICQHTDFSVWLVNSLLKTSRPLSMNYLLDSFHSHHHLNDGAKEAIKYELKAILTFLNNSGALKELVK